MNNFLDLGKKKKMQWEKNRQPYGALLELTPRCNMNCIHCYLQNHHDLKEMSYKEIIEILDILHSKGILFLTLTGGEIFTRKDFVDIYLYAKQKGFLVELFTNGMLLTDEIISVLHEYPPLLVDISLYGACEDTYKKITGITGAFEKVMCNCRKLVEADVRVSLKSPILKYTLPELSEMQRIAKSLGIVFSYSFEICATIDRDDVTQQYQVSMYDMLKSEFEDYKPDPNEAGTAMDNQDELPMSIFNCKVAKTSFVIDYQKRMCPCMKFRHKGITLENDNFDEIWHEFGKIQDIAPSETYKCTSCEAINYCEVCPAEMEFMYGDLEYRNESACKYAKARMAFYKNKLPVEKALNIFMEEVSI